MKTPRIARCLFVLILLFCSRLAFAQTDLSGEWAARYHEDPLDRRNGPEIGEYVGLPLNEAARQHAESWRANLLNLPEHQCIPHSADYENSFSNLRIWKEIDPNTQEIIAWHTEMQWMTPIRTIWMDGRPHPPDYAAHSFQGFSTGEWHANMLTVTTTHLKYAWVRRNGVPRSDQATLTEHFVRHGDVLTWITVVNDPAYLSEPFIRSRSFVLDPNQTAFPAYPCGPEDEVEESTRPAGFVPHYLPGANDQLFEFADKYGIPHEAVLGGQETLYPEYRKKLRELLNKQSGQVTK
jgi:hypothetical protein